MAPAFVLAACEGGAAGDPLLSRDVMPENGVYTLALLNDFTLDSQPGQMMAGQLDHVLASHCPAGAVSLRRNLTGGTAEVAGTQIRVTLQQSELCSLNGSMSGSRVPTVIEATVAALIVRNHDDVGNVDPHDPPWPGKMFSILAADGTELFRGGRLGRDLQLVWAASPWMPDFKFQRD
jgi:hypothetical protein